MGAVSTLVAAIKATIETTLGAAFEELQFSTDVERNKFRGGYQGYAVLPGELVETDGVNRFVTCDQEFEVILTETFGTRATGDQAQRTAADTLFSRIETLYAALVRTKAGAPSTVMLVKNLNVLPVEYLDGNVAVLRATVTIKFRLAL